MRYCLTLIAILCFFTQCKDNQSDKNIIVENYYTNGKKKDSITLNADKQKNGKCFYYDNDGGLDSTVTFKNGRRNGLKNKYFGEYGVYTYNFFNDSLIEERIYDTLNRLMYIAPLDVKSLPKTTFRLFSKRLYFDQDKGDTILIINSKLPPFNRGISVSGALFRDLKEQNSYVLTTSKHYDSLKQIIIKIKIFENNIIDYQVPTRVDSLIIPVK